MIAENTVKKIYLTVIDEVLSNVRESFLDEGYDEQLLLELKNMWEAKLNASRALQALGDTDNTSKTNAAPNNKLPVTGQHTKEVNIVKTELDSSTRSALNALPQSFHHHSSVASSSSSSHHNQHLNGNNNKKLLHTPQLDGNADNTNNVKLTKQMLKKMKGKTILFQVDGGNGGDSDIDDDDLDDIGGEASPIGQHGDDIEDDEAEDDKANNETGGNSEYEGKEDPDPLNSDDDLTEPGSPDSNSDLFDTDNVIVCQYDKITRIKNRWKFHLKDGIMNINSRDYLFSKANGDAEW